MGWGWGWESWPLESPSVSKERSRRPGRLCSPGLLMYMWMGFLLLSDCRNSSCAITRLATLSSICKRGWRGCPQMGVGRRLMGWLGISQDTRMGVRARVSKTGREEFRIQEMWGLVGIRGFGSREGGSQWAQSTGREVVRRVGTQEWGGDHR